MSVYFIRREGDPKGLVKIGYAVILSQRLAHLQTGCPEKLEVLAVLEGSAALESEIHRELAEYRVAGEWFAPSVKMQDMIDDANAEEDANAPAAGHASRRIPTIEESANSEKVVEITIAYVGELVGREMKTRKTIGAARDRVADQLDIPRTYLKRFWDRWRVMSDCSGNLYHAASWRVAHILEAEGRLTPELERLLRGGRRDGCVPPIGFRAAPAPTGLLQ